MVAPEQSVFLDITICMDVHTHPGPELVVLGRRQTRNGLRPKKMNISYDHSKLPSLRHTALELARPILSKLKSLGILWYRGRRGLRQKNNITEAEKRGLDMKPRCRIINHSNLIYIPCVKTTTTCAASSTGFAVPKSLFTDMDWRKQRTNVRALVVLKTHFRCQDINVICLEEPWKPL